MNVITPNTAYDSEHQYTTTKLGFKKCMFIGDRYDIVYKYFTL